VRAIADGLGSSSASHTTAVLLLGFGALALVALTVTLLEAFARPWWASATGLAASGAHVAVGELGAATTTACAAVAVAAALAVAAPPLVALLRRPDLTLATLV
jgi:hypothetical protein